MTGFIIILSIVLGGVWIFFHKKKRLPESGIADTPTSLPEPESSFCIDEVSVLSCGLNGRYVRVSGTRTVPRRTFVFGTMEGKYWGVPGGKEADRVYDIHIQEAAIHILDAGASAYIVGEEPFPQGRLPRQFMATMIRGDKRYVVALCDPKLADIRVETTLHQEEQAEVLGTLQATVTGYLLDFVREEYEEVRYLPGREEEAALLIPVPQAEPVVAGAGKI